MSEGDTSDTERKREYPDGERDALEERALIEFNDRISEHGRGKNWLRDEPRVHVQKATDELFLARGREDVGDIDGMEAHCANALNHILFALEIAYNNRPAEAREE